MGRGLDGSVFGWVTWWWISARWPVTRYSINPVSRSVTCSFHHNPPLSAAVYSNFHSIHRFPALSAAFCSPFHRFHLPRSTAFHHVPPLFSTFDSNLFQFPPHSTDFQHFLPHSVPLSNVFHQFMLEGYKSKLLHWTFCWNSSFFSVFRDVWISIILRIVY